MKQNRLYYCYNYNCLIYVISIKDGIITFASATFMRDVFTTISQYESSIDQLSKLRFTMLNKLNYHNYLHTNNLIKSLSVKDNYNSPAYKFSTELLFITSKHVNIWDNYKKYENWKC